MLSTRVAVVDIAGRRLEKDPAKFAEAACSLAQKRMRQQAVLIGTALANIAALTAMFSDAAAGNTKASQALNRKVRTQRKHANKAYAAYCGWHQIVRPARAAHGGQQRTICLR